jgi:hypothetical protein
MRKRSSLSERPTYILSQRYFATDYKVFRVKAHISHVCTLTVRKANIWEKYYLLETLHYDRL